MRLFHTTSNAVAQQIVAIGFEDADFLGIARGVCFSDRPLDGADGVARYAEVVLSVEVPKNVDLAEFEVREEGRPAGAYREWLIPAEVANTWPRLVAEIH